MKNKLRHLHYTAIATAVLLLASSDLTTTSTQAADKPDSADEVRVHRNVRIPMRDGVSLAADVYRPPKDGKYPALMTLVYYPTGQREATFFAKHGYSCVVVNSRGRNGSEGEWGPYVNEPHDGYDAQQWIGVQPWCNGKIGMYGQSYNAFTQIATTPLASPHLKCILPLEGQQTNFGHIYNDGVLQLNMVLTFGLYATGPTRTGPHIPIGPHYLQLPLMAAADKADNPQAQRIKTWMKHARYDDYWKSYGVKDKYHKVKVPALFASGWYDNLVHENWRNFKGFSQQAGSEAARRGTKIRISGGRHGQSGVDLPMHLRWYDYWLKGIDTGIQNEPPIQIYVMGADKWRHENEWPLARTRFTNFYLHGNGKANTSKGDGSLNTSTPPKESQPDKYVYDPANPVYTLGGQMSTHQKLWGPKDRQSVQQRQDVLVYTTAPLKEDMEVTGPVELVLYAASDATDTDFTATLTDVHPDGKAIHICEGIRGATFRDSLEHPTPIAPGEIYKYKISLWETSMLFKKGHRIRLEVSSSNFPRYARNQNTGLPLGTSVKIQKARQTIYHDTQHPSHLILPVIPLEGKKKELGNIMPLGDSITAGYKPGGCIPGGYRQTLHHNLTAAGCLFRLVGSQNKYPSPALTTDGNEHHEGHDAYTIQQVIDGIVKLNWLDVDPDIILLHIGANDMLDPDVVTAPHRFDKLLEEIIKRKPDAHIIVAKIIGGSTVTNDARTKAYDRAIVIYNAAIAKKVAARKKLGQNVSLVDMYALLNINRQNNAAGKPLFIDISHPNQTGYDLMGNTWAEVVKSSCRSKTRSN